MSRMQLRAVSRLFDSIYKENSANTQMKASKDASGFLFFATLKG